MSVDFNSLLTPATEDEIQASLLALLASGAVAGIQFPVTSWRPGGVALTLIALISRGLAQIAILVALIGRSGFVLYATGAWLTLTAAQYFKTDRKVATFASGALTLASTPSAPSYTIVAGQLAFGWNSLVYRNTSGGTLAPSSTLLVSFQAEKTGAVYNAPIGGVSTLLTPLAGVSIKNNVLGFNTPPGNAQPTIVVQGADEERDDALAVRAMGRWGTVGTAANEDGYATWATTASDEVTRVATAENAPDYGSITVTIANDTGAPSGGAVTAVSQYINGPPIKRRPLCATVIVQGATNHTISVTATLYVKAGANPAAKAQAEAAIIAYSKTLSIATASGGWTVPGGVTVFRDKLIAALESPVGIVNSVLSVPAVDVDLAAGEVPQLVPVVTISLV
jgi:phage-related baseplate assembly protein